MKNTFGKDKSFCPYLHLIYCQKKHPIDFSEGERVKEKAELSNFAKKHVGT